MKRCLLAVAIVMPVVANSQEPAQPLSYDYISAGLVVPELDEIGFEVDGSISVGRRYIAFGRYFTFEPRNGFDYDSLQIGAGRVWNVRRNVDFVASLAYADNDIDTPSRKAVTKRGFIAGAQLRGWATRRIELSGTAMLDNSRGSSTDTVIDLGVQFVSDTRISYGGRIRTDEDDTTLFLGARFYFGDTRRAAR